MSMLGTGSLRHFLCDEHGAASVDWVILSALCVSLGLGVTNVVGTEMANLSYDIRAQLEQDMINNPFDVDHRCTYLYVDPASAASSSGGSCTVSQLGDALD